MNHSNVTVRLCVCLAACLAAGPAMAAPVTVAVPPADVSEQAEVDLPITLSDCDGLGALQMDLVYPPELLEFKGVSAGALAGGALVESNSAKAGLVKLALVAGQPISGDGVIVNVRFKVLGKGGATGELNVQNARAWERDSNFEMRVATESGGLKVKPRLAGLSAAGGLWVWLAVGGGFVLVVVLVIIVTSRRRTRGV